VWGWGVRGVCVYVWFVVGGEGVFPGGVRCLGVVCRGWGSVWKKVWRRPLLRVRSPLSKVS
jgi:hypothetical protein